MTFKRKFESLPTKKNGKKRRELLKWDKYASMPLLVWLSFAELRDE